MFAVNVGAPYFIIQLALPPMDDVGRIINIGSGAARTAVPGEPVYSMMNRARQRISAGR
ncbi:SDR family NAD(P)-dependent oxidoreductase [Streptomyces sp. NPDC005970]|uniref:SDR family NAD(P)-dependent oxidoreductase n=1 Tax=Streptomyces sp. NPDC005970 TaxID=3156723 RepID=UPI00340B9D4B